MSNRDTQQAFHRLVQAAGADADDRDLLERYVAARDGNAFAALMTRHAPMVLRICRRVLRDDHLAEDAVQATFLTLARKASSLRVEKAVPAWLCRVAFRAALRARSTVVRQMNLLEHTDRFRLALAPEAIATSEVHLRALLDEEISRLPETYRVLVALCYWGNKTYEEAALLVGRSRGAVSSWLARARKILRQRLIRRGVAPSLAAIAITLRAGDVVAEMPRRALDEIARVAQRIGARESIAGLVSTHVQELAEGELRSMRYAKLKYAIAFVAGLCALAFGSLTIFLSAAPAPPRSSMQPTLTDHRELAADFQHVAAKDESARVEIKLAASFETKGNFLRTVAFSPDAAYFLVSGGFPIANNFEARIKLWNLSNGREEPGPPALRSNIAHFALDKDGNHIALCTAGQWTGAINRPQIVEQGALKILEVAKATEVALKTASHSYSSVAFSPDGKTLAAGANDKDARGYQSKAGAPIRFFDVATKKEGTPLLGHKGIVQSIAFSPNGKKLASASYLPPLTPRDPVLGELKLWDIAGGKAIALDGHKGGLWAVAYSPDGKFVAASGDDGIIRLWDAETGKLAAEFKGHTLIVTSLAFSPDGKLLASSGANPADAPAKGELKVWDIGAQKQLVALPGHKDAVRSVAFSWDGTKLASSDSAGVVNIWNVDAPSKK